MSNEFHVHVMGTVNSYPQLFQETYTVSVKNSTEAISIALGFAKEAEVSITSVEVTKAETAGSLHDETDYVPYHHSSSDALMQENHIKEISLEEKISQYNPYAMNLINKGRKVIKDIFPICFTKEENDLSDYKPYIKNDKP